MYSAIKNFQVQFQYKPSIENAQPLKAKRFIVCGMGGSSLAALLLRRYRPELRLTVHRDYGLPDMPEEELRESLIIASSYSGNTEETADALSKAIEKGLQAAAISTGGKIEELAKSHGLPFIRLPSTGMQPRIATGYSFVALLKMMGLESDLREAGLLARTLDPFIAQTEGSILGDKLMGHIPVIYASERNAVLAENWKIKFNENAKIPAFFNRLPEANHNEMTGFDIKDSTKELSSKLIIIFLRDDEDHPRTKKRMDVLEQLYRARGLRTESVAVEGKNTLIRIFLTLLKGDWTSYYLAMGYGNDPENVPMVEEFKKLI
jgi:glucose/mannose-6-phosphate isomerase